MIDSDPSATSFEVEPVKIPYYLREGARQNLRHYIPDLIVTYDDGRKVMIEVKPRAFIDSAVNVAKFEAAREYCDWASMTFQVWTQDDLFPEGYVSYARLCRESSPAVKSAS